MKPDDNVQQLITQLQTYATLLVTIAGLAAVVIARFLIVFRRAIKADVGTVQQNVAKVQADIPVQVQTHIEKPLSSFQEQIEKSLANLASTGTTFATTMNDIVTNYQNQSGNYERQIALISQQLQHTLDQNKQLEKQLFDHKVFAEDLQKGRAADFDRIRTLEIKQRQMEEIQQAQAEGSKARDKRIKELQDHLDEERRQASEQRAEQTKLMDVMRNEREAERQRWMQEVAELRAEVERLRGIEGERALLLEKVASLETKSERDQQRITELEQEVAHLKSLSNGIDASSASTSPQVSHERSD